MSVFEFGCGSSTLWWARRVRRVVACEHDQGWFERVRDSVPANAVVHLASIENGGYSESILKFDKEFDIVVIDGRDRVRCAYNSLPALKQSGVIIWDNSDRSEYKPAYDFLRRHEFRRVDFTGFGPINAYSWSTSIFYRSENCMGL